MFQQNLKRWGALLFTLLICACVPDRQGEIQAVVVAQGPQGEYGLEIGTVANLDSLRELRGRDFEFRAASGVNESLFDASLDPGRSFALEWSEDEAGVVIPADLHSLMALSAYRALDLSASLFRDFGFELQEPLKVLYLPRYDHTLLGDLRLELTDNAAFVFEFRALLLLPSFVLAELPLLLNQGVLAHELGHAIVHEALFGLATELPQSGQGASEKQWLVAHRHLAAMHEGVADLVGFVVSADPDFLSTSVPADRDLSSPRRLSASDLRALNTPKEPLPTDFDAHSIGSVMARTVYEMWAGASHDGDEAARKALGRGIVRTLKALEFHPERFNLASFPQELVKGWLADLEVEDPALAEAERRRCCKILQDRLEADWLSICGDPQ